MRFLKAASSLPIWAKACDKCVNYYAEAIKLAAFATSLFLSAYPAHRTYSVIVRRPPTTERRMAISVAVTDYDCSAGGRIGGKKFSKEGMEEGISAALEMLETCPACRKFYGATDPVKLLMALVKKGKLVVSDRYPAYLQRDNRSSPWRVGKKLKRFNKHTVAVTTEFAPEWRGHKYLKPCIYINASRYLGKDSEEFASRLTLRQERALAILHELAHVVGVIPSDGVGKLSAWKSAQNQLCVIRNCSPCAKNSIGCVHAPRPTPTQVPSGRNPKLGSPVERKQP